MLKTAFELERMGTALARDLSWNGVEVLQVAWSALTEANFHAEAEIIEQIAKALNESSVELKYTLTVEEI